MLRYLIALAVFFLGLISVNFMGAGPSAWFFIDIPTFIAVGLFPFLFISIIFGFKGMASAFSILKEKEPDQGKLLKALSFFKIYGKTTWIMGFIVFIMGVLSILRDLNDYSAVWANLCIALISPIYCGIIHFVIIIPFTVFIKKQLKE